MDFTIYKKDDEGNIVYQDGKPVVDQVASGLAAINQNTLSNVRASNLIYNRSQIEWFEKFNRFGCLDPYNKLTYAKEYLFFTKPDCHIYTPKTTNLQPVFANNSFFLDCHNRYPYVLQSLQRSVGGSNTNFTNNPFMSILSNSVKSTIDLQGLTAEQMDGPANIYGTSISYRKDAWKGDEGVEFSLEFEDTKYLEIYIMLKAYEEYERMKNIGMIYPPNINGAPETGEVKHNFNSYIANKELHDTFGIYRIIVGEDMSEIIYWSYICGAYFNNVPRDAFNDLKNGDGLQYSVDFKAFCAVDMDPIILSNFDTLISNSGYTYSADNIIPVIGDSDSTLVSDLNEPVNTKWAAFPYVVKDSAINYQQQQSGWLASQSMQHKYKLVWCDAN